MKDNYDRSVSLQCPTCGGTDFESSTSEQITCWRCSRVFTKDELREANGALIEAELDELKSEILKDVRADLRRAFSKWK